MHHAVCVLINFVVVVVDIAENLNLQVAENMFQNARDVTHVLHRRLFFIILLTAVVV